jgi:hypothetical protein
VSSSVRRGTKSFSLTGIPIRRHLIVLTSTRQFVCIRRMCDFCFSAAFLSQLAQRHEKSGSFFNRTSASRRFSGLCRTTEIPPRHTGFSASPSQDEHFTVERNLGGRRVRETPIALAVPLNAEQAAI